MISRIIDNGRKLLSSTYRMKKLYAFDASDPPPVDPTGKRILFIPWYNRELFFLREGFVAKACEWRGAKTALLHCDVRIGPTENGDLAPRYGIRHPQITGGVAALNHLNQEQLLASDYYQELDRVVWRKKLNLLDPDSLESYTHDGLLIGDLAVASAIRTTLGMGPEWEIPSFTSDVVELLITCIELIELYTRAYQAFRPDLVYMSHAIYVTWGIAFRVARKMKIEVAVYNGSYRKNTIRVYRNAPNAPFPEAEWPTYRDQPLTDRERTWAEAYFRSRADLSQENLDLFAGSQDPERIQRFISTAKAEGKTLAALFTNMSWDAYAFSTDAVFPSMKEWANYTLEYARDNPDLRLIFKIHPAEDFFNVPERYRLKNHLGDIPDNVLLVTELDKVPPFSFFQDIDFGIINTSTVAMEMALFGIPVLTSGGNGHYEHRGFTLSPDDIDDYEKKLDQLIREPGSYSPDREKALRYLFYRFYTEAIPFDALDITSTTINAIHPNSYADLRPGNYPGLDVIAEGIMTGSPYVYTVPPPIE